MTPYLTAEGMELMLRALNGESLVFTHVAIGSGSRSNPSQATSLAHQQKLLTISSSTIADGYISLICETTNADVSTGFRITEYGIFAQDMDDSSEEVLYAYIKEDYSKADYIPAAGDRPKEIKIAPTAKIGTAENVAAVINASIEYVARVEFQAHLDDTQNPHNVTKAQLGLGEVENVAVNDMAPTFTAAQYSSANYDGVKLSSGNKLPILFGKLKSFVEAVISHLLNKSNPHEVTIDQLNAASREHTHSASDINEGKLPVAHGGTGLSEVELGAVLIGSGSRLVARTGYRAFYREPNAVAPIWGTLPVNCGGTGYNTEEGYTADILSRVKSQGVPILVQGTYTGNGSTSAGVTLNFASAPKMIMVSRANTDNMNAVEDGACFYAVKGTTKHINLNITWGDTSVTFISNYTGSVSGQFAKLGLNSSGVTYNYVALL